MDLSEVDLAVCTIEKANSFINRLMADERLDDLGIVVADEIHMLADPSRGCVPFFNVSTRKSFNVELDVRFLLEVLLSKIRLLSTRSTIQLVCMSATLPNVEAVSKWLQASHFVSNFRPVPLHEYFVMDGKGRSGHGDSHISHASLTLFFHP